MFFDDGIDNENDARHTDAQGRRAKPVRRPKARRRNSTSRTPATPAAPGGIRQRRNKRWAW